MTSLKAKTTVFEEGKPKKKEEKQKSGSVRFVARDLGVVSEEEARFKVKLVSDSHSDNEILTNWNRCANMRISQLRSDKEAVDFFKQWPQYKGALGYRMVIPKFL